MWPRFLLRKVTFQLNNLSPRSSPDLTGWGIGL
jgi:hypothetical protein